MKIYVKDTAKSADDYYVMKECRSDILLQVNDVFYHLNFMTTFLLNQEVSCDDFYYIKNLFPVENVSIENITKIIKRNVEHKYYEDLLPEKNVSISEWIQVYPEKQN